MDSPFLSRPELVMCPAKMSWPIPDCSISVIQATVAGVSANFAPRPTC